MFFDMQQEGEKGNSYSYMHYAQLTTVSNFFQSFPIDFLRYEWACWIWDQDDAKQFEKFDNRNVGEILDITVCKLSTTKTKPLWTPERLTSEWRLEEICSPAHPTISGEKLIKPRKWEHLAKLKPLKIQSPYFPLRLLSMEQASPYREGHSHMIESLIRGSDFPHPKHVIGLRKYTSDKISNWDFDAWRKAGWELTAIRSEESRVLSWLP